MGGERTIVKHTELLLPARLVIPLKRAVGGVHKVMNARDAFSRSSIHGRVETRGVVRNVSAEYISFYDDGQTRWRRVHTRTRREYEVCNYET